VREFKISHPDKILIQAAGITKRDIMEYYKAVELPLLNYVKGRALAYKRYPHGFPGVNFFQRNMPKFAPEWITHQLLGLKKKADYIIAANIETILWLVNICALEFHTTQTKVPHLMNPDMLVLDLDPPHKSGDSIYENFKMARDLALDIKPLIESMGYKTFVKTSGKKGVHIFCPVKPLYSYDEVFEAAKQIGERIVSSFNNVTLKISKDERIGKLLIDIYRNHTLQFTSMPYGLRATDTANISMPVTWERLEHLDSPMEFTIKTVPAILEEEKDPWENIYDYQVDLHTKV